MRGSRVISASPRPPPPAAETPARDVRESTPAVERNRSYLMNKARAFLELFFAMWFVMGNVWVFDARLGSFQRAPRLYALCYGEKEEVRQLPCTHVFHLKCVDRIDNDQGFLRPHASGFAAICSDCVPVRPFGGKGKEIGSVTEAYKACLDNNAQEATQEGYP
uniref:RING-type domain-containing protein n=1 Tax=Zea mays TaxID=4577 RepID=A0A804PRZ1_MAIZE